ncbi:AP-2 complex subunit mu [Smittium culicis]|uniref:AP-2 complex subunit mu n=2 Tax=Smittium culicis TaxID=133412 RepID=A0A1R1XYL5_9FUNG|nr:AP-2 complex subunit mu [Smittium culicis]
MKLLSSKYSRPNPRTKNPLTLIIHLQKIQILLYILAVVPTSPVPPLFTPKSNQNIQYRSSLRNSSTSKKNKTYSSPSLNKFASLSETPSKHHFNNVEININSNESKRIKVSNSLYGSQNNNILNEIKMAEDSNFQNLVNDWLRKFDESRIKLKSESKAKKEYLHMKKVASDNDSYNIDNETAISIKRKANKSKKKNDEPQVWRSRYEKLYNLRMTESEKKYTKMIKQVEAFLTAADNKVELQKQHISALNNQLESLSSVNNDLHTKQTEAALKEEQWKSKEKELEEKVFMLKNQLIQSESTATLLQKQRRASSTYLGSSQRETIKLIERLSGFKVVDVSSDMEGTYYVCSFSGNYGELDFIIGEYQDEEELEYIPNTEDLSSEKLLELQKSMPGYLLEPFTFDSKSSNLLFWRICDSLNKPREKASAEVFRINVLSLPLKVDSPINTFGDTTYYHINYQNIWICITSNSNIEVAMVFEFLYKFIGVCYSYFGSVNEDSIKSNFVLIYQLLDEMIDFGYIQNTDFESLALSIKSENTKSSSNLLESKVISAKQTGTVTWRNNDIIYKKNQAFVDIIESVNVLLSSKGTVIKADVDGKIVMKSYLSGMPECRLGLNENINIGVKRTKSQVIGGSESFSPVAENNAGIRKTAEIVDCQFHQCVRLGQFDQNRVINFIPPDGVFELMRYRTSSEINLPFLVFPVVSAQPLQYSGGSNNSNIFKNKSSMYLEIQVLLKAAFNSKLIATNVCLEIPTPKQTTSCNISVHGIGKARHVPENNCILWTINKFPGNTETSINATVELSSDVVSPNAFSWARPPMSLTFKLTIFTPSGLIVKFLQIQESGNYKSVKWVRYLTNAGSFTIRY